MNTNRRQFIITLALATAGFATGIPSGAIETKAKQLDQTWCMSGM